MNLAEIQQEIYDRMGYASSPDADVVRRMLANINDTQKKVLSLRGMGKLRQALLTATSIANNPFMALPQAAVSLRAVTDRATQKPLSEVFIRDLRMMDPGLTRVTSFPDAYAIYNMSSGVALQPSAACQPFVVSTSASDVGTAYIEGITTGGYPRSVSVAVNGTTPAGFAPTDFIEIVKFYMSTVAVGVVTLTQGSGGTELSRISVARQSARYTLLHLFGTPSTSSTYYCDVDRYIFPMANAGDEPFIPDDFHDIYAIGARKIEYEKRKDWSAYSAMDREWKDRVGDLRAWVRRNNTRPDGVPRAGWSQLGPYFPAGS